MKNKTESSDTLKIENYLHLYLGCEVKALDGGTMRYKLCGINFDGTGKFKTIPSGFAMYLYEWKLILRPLSDMTESDKKFYGNRQGMAYDPLEFVYLLKEGYDLFGLIEAGLVFDKTTLK